MIILEDKKIDILLEALKERYESIHTIRERVQSLSLWIVGIFLGISGWLIQNTLVLDVKQKITYTSVFVLALVIFRAFYLENLEKGFNSQRIVSAKIEDCLELYKEGSYKENETVYPKNWRKSGTKGCEGRFFFNNYILIYLGTVILISILWLKGIIF